MRISPGQLFTNRQGSFGRPASVPCEELAAGGPLALRSACGEGGERGAGAFCALLNWKLLEVPELFCDQILALEIIK